MSVCKTHIRTHTHTPTCLETMGTKVSLPPSPKIWPLLPSLPHNLIPQKLLRVFLVYLPFIISSTKVRLMSYERIVTAVCVYVCIVCVCVCSWKWLFLKVVWRRVRSWSVILKSVFSRGSPIQKLTLSGAHILIFSKFSFGYLWKL